MPDLVLCSSAKARQLYGLVYPHDVWWVRYGWRFANNLRQFVNRSPMRVYAHWTHAVEAILTRQGCFRRSYSELGVWQIAVYTRVHD